MWTPLTVVTSQELPTSSVLSAFPWSCAAVYTDRSRRGSLAMKDLRSATGVVLAIALTLCGCARTPMNGGSADSGFRGADASGADSGASRVDTGLADEVSVEAGIRDSALDLTAMPASDSFAGERPVPFDTAADTRTGRPDSGAVANPVDTAAETRRPDSGADTATPVDVGGAGCMGFARPRPASS